MGDDAEFGGDFRDGTVNYKSSFTQIYTNAGPIEVSAARLAEAEERLNTLPLDTVPDVSALPNGSVIRFAPNPLFVGRESDLITLADALMSDGAAAIGQIAAASGLGGVGKTQLAAEFSHRYGTYFQGGVFWVSFADPDAIANEIASCGGATGLCLKEGFDQLPLEEQIQMVGAAWHSPLPRLLIFDNCEDEALVDIWRPKTGRCRILVTSRRTDWPPHLGISALPLGTLSRAESIELLCKHRPDLTPDNSELNEIADQLGDLPLALHLAGSFLRRCQYASLGTPESYLAALQSPDLLNHPSLTEGDGSPTDHEQHVGRTFALSLNQMDDDNEVDTLALSALSRLACFAPGEPVPRFLLIASMNINDDDTAQMQAADALQRITDLGLAEIESDGALALHRLLANFIRNALDNIPEGRQAVEQAIETEADRLFIEGYPAPLQAWQQHLRAIAEAAVTNESENAADLLLSLGNFEQMVAAYDNAGAAFERALEISEETLGPEHPDVATGLNNLAMVYKETGRYEDAEPLYKRALEIGEKTLGPDHHVVAIRLNNLAMLYKDTGRYEDAESLLKRALTIGEKTLGPEHPNVATWLNNLAMVYQDTDRYEEAEPLYKRALTIDEKTLGPDHPDVAIDLNNLAMVYQDTDRYEEAEHLLKRALTIDEKTLGPDHPDVAIDLNNLATLYRDTGRYDEAEPLLKRALEIGEKTLGPDHPDVATFRNNLARLRGNKSD